ncbi:phosphatidylcholine synthase [Brucella melitensis]|nr:phosphatidylcholine synthase [Brucella melitensis]
MGTNLSFISGAIIVVSSAIYYADTGIRPRRTSSRVSRVWNMVVFTLFIVSPANGWPRNGRGFGDPFLPAINLPASGAVVRLRPLNLTIFLLWCAFGVIALYYCWMRRSGPYPAFP